MRGFRLVAVAVMVVWAAGLSSVSGREAKPEQELGRAKAALGEAKRAVQAGAEATAVDKYGEALIALRRIERKDPSWKQEEVGAALAESEAGYIRTLTGMVVKLQALADQRAELAGQQGEIIKKIDILVKNNAEMMKFLEKNRDLIEKIEATLGR